MKNYFFILLLISFMLSCNNDKTHFTVDIYESSAAGNKMTKLKNFTPVEKITNVNIDTSKEYQVITGIGGSFTESSAYLLNQLSKTNRNKILEAYFGDDGAKYSLTRTHINSCDFSLSSYSYAPTEGDVELKDFTIEEDRDDIIPMIKDAMNISSEGFKIISSPWTAPPWMKDNNNYVGGKLLPKYYDTWALFFSKYIEAYKKEGIDIWGLTVENEPLGNGNNWESMHFTAAEMTDFVSNHLGPSLEANGHDDIKVLGYDQNRDHLKEWVDEMYKNNASSKYFDGTAIHWYASTFDVFPDVLQYAHNKAPEKYLIETEGCVDAEVPHWKEDDWYWSKEATDWGWDWASAEEKHLHPKYVPVYRYARDIIGCLNNWVDGWVDWNMVLDKQGGPNWFENWCLAPVIVDPDLDEVYFTPLYYAMTHFSRFIRPGAKRIKHTLDNEEIQLTCVKNQDGSIAIVILNENDYPVSVDLTFGVDNSKTTIDGKAIQTMLINPLNKTI